MGVKPGYKQTEIGMIPEDWNFTTVSQLVHDGVLDKPLDGNHGNIHPKSGDFVSYGIPFVMANNIREGRVDLSNCSFIRKEQADSLKKGFSLPGDVLLTHKATIGNTAVVGDLPFEYIMLTPQVTYYRVADRTRLSNFYLRQFFDSAPFQSVLLSMSGGGTRSYIGITAQLQLPVVVPGSIVEQRAIAEALSDADALIESMEQLIAKKRSVKQGAMQELLTGKKRLPGFSCDWAVKRLGELAQLYQPVTISADVFTAHGYPVYGANGVVGYYSDFNHDSWQITVTCRGSTCGTVNKTVDRCWITGNAMVVNCDANNQMDKTFLYYLLASQDLSVCITGTGQPQIVRTPLAEFDLNIPKDITEQGAIAAILTDMDAEIAALETKLAKTRSLKLGMMQELLTGRIRLV